MAKDKRTFTRGRMNKELDERLIPDGEYMDALNVRIGSTEEDEMGVIENSFGNTKITEIRVQNTLLSSNALCIGAFSDDANETLYWFVHDPTFTASSNTGKLDLVLSYNANTSVTTYHVVSMDDGGGLKTTLNFNPSYLITGVNKVEDLLFFTDNYNPPRRINVTTTYAAPTVGDVDQFTATEILVIKKPPTALPTADLPSPEVTLTNNTTIKSEFMKERFICFAYRWKYDDNEYSATSQFSAPAFLPKDFDFDSESYLNEGMVNKYNFAEVKFNTGSSLVKGIDVLFKEADDPTIKVIEKLDKAELSISDDTDYTINFSDSKIFTILPESEILRLYDNVPKLSQAQTIMGNRLMYGNYQEGYDLIDKDGNPTELRYWANRRSTSFQVTTLDPSAISLSNGDYTLPISAGGVLATVSGGKISFDLTEFATNAEGNTELKAGYEISFTFTLDYDPAETQLIGTGAAPAQTPSTLNLDATFVLAQSYDSIEDWVNSESFQNILGTADNIKPVYAAAGETSCDGGTFTDVFNCSLDQELGAYTLYTTGITSATSVVPPIVREPIAVTVSGNVVTFQFPALRYVDNPALPIATDYFVFYNNTSAASATFQVTGGARSLHSNRNYEVGMVYMDDFGRSTTALVSSLNSVYFPCDRSDLKNQIRVAIPPSQLAPAWATKYKFVIKPAEEGYNTILSNIFGVDDTRNLCYILLQGENARKVDEGDRLIVKSDTSGPINRCDYITVLEKKVFGADELPSGSELPTGTYMVVDSAELSLSSVANSIVDFPKLSAKANSIFTNYAVEFSLTWGLGLESRAPFILQPLNFPKSENAACVGEDFTVPEGSLISLEITSTRIGKGNACEQRDLSFSENYTASEDHDNLADWFENEGIASTIISGAVFTGGDPPIEVTYAGRLPATLTDCGNSLTYDNQRPQDVQDLGVPSSFLSEFRLGIIDETGGRRYLSIIGTPSCGSSQKKRSDLEVKLKVIRATTLLVFETLPQDANPDLFYESSTSYDIDTTTGFHSGNVQSQTASQNAIIDTAFFNCYSFGNGVESYKIRESLEGKSFRLGNRATTTAGQDYKEITRYADMTYSGVYNQESNVNKLNEFNLGLLNFKPLEQSFGPIQKMFARETDVLVLQEDKISYVTAGKNILTDAVGGGTVTSVPEVLGQQVARIEQYGISDNPESFTSYGYDKFFTDAKRGAVIQLRGAGGSNEALKVISDANMSTWFRDLFKVSLNYQKLGGYDPYADEYVLASNTRELPSTISCIPCGTTQTYALGTVSTTKTFCVDVGYIAENFTVDHSFIDAGTATIQVIYNSIVNKNKTTGALGVDLLIDSTKDFTTITPAILAGDIVSVYDVNGIAVQTTTVVSVDSPTQITVAGGSFFGTFPVTYSISKDNSSSVGVGSPLTIIKDSPTPTTAEVIIEGTGTVQVTVNCPVGSPLNIVQVCLTDPSKASELIHNEFKFTQGDYVSPLGSTQVQFSSSVIPPVVSQFDTLTGLQGQGYFPSDLSSVSVISNMFGDDNYVYQTANSLRWLRTIDVYGNNAADITTLLSLATTLVTSGASPTVTGSFNMPAGNDPYLYLVYDYRTVTAVTLCRSGVAADACCCTGGSSTYYVNGTSLSNATGVFSDAALTTPSADGYYSDGTIVRYLTSGALGTSVTCGICNPDCGVDVVQAVNADWGHYRASFDLTSSTGAIVIKYTPNSVPNGILCSFDGTNYNKLSSASYGKLQSTVPSNNYTVCGQSASQCTGIVGTTNYPKYLANGTSYQAQSGTQSITLAAGDLELTAAAPSTCVMVIPKPSATPISLRVDIVAPCKGGTTWEIDVACAAAIPATSTTALLGSSVLACGAATGTNHYIVHADGTTGGAPTLHAYVFTDANGATPLGVGWIGYGAATYEIADGIIVTENDPC